MTDDDRARAIVERFRLAYIAFLKASEDETRALVERWRKAYHWPHSESKKDQ
jgi:hypothetical protein